MKKLRTSDKKQRNITLRFLLMLVILLYTASPCRGALNDSVMSHPLVHSLWITTGADYVANSMEDDIREKIPSDQKIYVNTALPINLRYSFSFTDPKVKNYYPGGYQGVSLGIYNLGALQSRGFSKATHNIGFPVLAYVFQGGPFHKFNRSLSLNYEWNFGAAFGWKPWSEENQNFNLTVGSRVNAYLNLDLNLLWQLNPHTGLFVGVAVSHFSNGNTSFPNPGVNSFGIRLGLIYTLNPVKAGFQPVLIDTLRKRKIEYDLTLWGATRKRVYRGGEEPVLLPGHYANAGLSFSPMVRLNTWWKVGGALDFQWDQSSDMKRHYIDGSTTQDIRFSTPSFWRQLSVGISAHGELVMPIFALNVGIGYNIISPWEHRGFYQNVSLKTYLYSGLFLNVGYELRNFYQQGCLLLGLGYTI